jgi:hypothetical protein
MAKIKRIRYDNDNNAHPPPNPHLLRPPAPTARHLAGGFVAGQGSVTEFLLMVVFLFALYELIIHLLA